MLINNLGILKLTNVFMKFLPLRWHGAFVGRGGSISCPIEIGKGTVISNGICVKGYGQVRIGKYCAIGADVKIITSNHDTALPTMNFVLQQKLLGKIQPSKQGCVKLGNDVWVGDNVVILPGVEIADGAVIGAGSIVTKCVGPYEVQAGVPARLVKLRLSKDLATKMQRLAWWNWDEKRMINNKNFFSGPINDISIDSVI
jgi:virginiamycin A acetyltransferase